MTDPIGTAQDREMIEALDNIKFGLDFAYEQGLHEFGYDPVASVRDALQSRIAEVGRLTEALADPAAVHVNMLRGTIARPSVRNIWHLYGEEAILAEAPDEVRAALSLQRRPT